MYEDFGTIINRGLRSWVRNPNICIPFVLSFFFEMVLYILFFGVMGLLIFSSNSGTIIDPAAISQTELLSMAWKGFTDNIFLSALLILVFFLIGVFIQSFFIAGAIGMAKKASETGDTVLSDMVTSGSKNIFRLFLTVLLIVLLVLAGIIFMVPGALAIGDPGLLIKNPEASLQGIGVMTSGAVLWGLYIIILNIVLSVTSYALVIDELEPLEALSESFHFFMKNKIDVFLIWGSFVGLSFINAFIGEYIGSRSLLVTGFTYMLPVFILRPLVTVFWTRLYVSRKGKKLYNPADLLSGPDGP
jgi:hypothetical protein